ncbi:hypothetical protein Pogu_1454 [Pyrobaculum oguniense TE7]|uniref:Uncharacterized protein n=1 Tax=Pyrobaculum oguniense (strain DSM 13380 / JCM 10595 / TE7) TaxID=698757 RepID=H6QAK1_PYROT|nr:hypothetical protein Pogu_1454 [Pyrobaculum oguniense TE7]
MDELVVPGCPEGSLRAVAYIKERQPGELVVKTVDEDCVKVLKLVLPLFNYFVVDEFKEGEFHTVKVRRGKT